MRTLCYAVLVFVLTANARGMDQTQLDKFKNTESPELREEMIRQAPAEDQDMLRQIDLHLSLLRIYNGEAGLAEMKRRYLAVSRGLGSLQDVFFEYDNVWQAYIGRTGQIHKHAGMSRKHLSDEEGMLRAKEERLAVKRLRTALDLAYRLAATKRALLLAKRAQVLQVQMSKTTSSYNSSPVEPVTKRKLRLYEAQIAKIYEEMKALPTLTPEQIQREYNAIPEANIPHKVTLRTKDKAWIG